ncbi:MAG: permease prefix domain 1-containing protein, partial [Blastocatellia bacterium]
MGIEGNNMFRIAFWRFRAGASRVGSLFRGRSLENDLNDELRSHIEMLVRDNIRGGMTPEEAERAAGRSFGGIDQTKEMYRDQRGLPVIETLLQDLRYGV